MEMNKPKFTFLDGDNIRRALNQNSALRANYDILYTVSPNGYVHAAHVSRNAQDIVGHQIDDTNIQQVLESPEGLAITELGVDWLTEEEIIEQLSSIRNKVWIHPLTTSMYIIGDCVFPKDNEFNAGVLDVVRVNEYMVSKDRLTTRVRTNSEMFDMILYSAKSNLWFSSVTSARNRLARAWRESVQNILRNKIKL